MEEILLAFVAAAATELLALVVKWLSELVEVLPMGKVAETAGEVVAETAERLSACVDVSHRKFVMEALKSKLEHRQLRIL